MSCRFDLILFDADETLFDFRQSEQAAFEACLTCQLGPGDYRSALEIYREISLPLWAQLERRSLTLEELRDVRWAQLAARCSFEYSVSAISAAYVLELAHHAHLVDGALEVCRMLAGHCQLGIVTNGFQIVQQARLEASGLAPSIDFLVTSESVGAAKPAAPIFERALELAARPLQRTRVLMVGDRLASDIAGGQRMGFATCWYNPHRHPAPTADVPDHTIHELAELLAVVLD
jgi:2-haloacid dehalogenase